MPKKTGVRGFKYVGFLFLTLLLSAAGNTAVRYVIGMFTAGGSYTTGALVSDCRTIVP